MKQPKINGRDYSIDRSAQDEFALESHRRALQARDEGRFKDQIVAVQVPQRKGDPVTIEEDEPPRPDISLEGLARLRPAFEEGGTVTAGNSSGLNDGAAAVLLAVRGRGVRKRMAADGSHRHLCGGGGGAESDGYRAGIRHPQGTETGGAVSGRHRSRRAERSIRRGVSGMHQGVGTGSRPVNVNGGAIALGHPLGCSGARIMTSLVHEMRRRDSHRGLATMCIGVGQGIATIVESV